MEVTATFISFYQLYHYSVKKISVVVYILYYYNLPHLTIATQNAVSTKH